MDNAYGPYHYDYVQMLINRVHALDSSRLRCHDMLIHMLDHFEPSRFADGDPLGPSSHAYDDCVRFMKEEFGEEEE